MAGPTYVVKGNPLGEFYRSYERWTQARPYSRPLRYKSLGWAVLKNSRSNSYSASGVQSILMAGLNTCLETAMNKAVSKFYGELRAVTDLATAIAERKSSVDMIQKRALQLARAARSIKKGKFKDAARTLGMGKPPKGASRKKQFANNWLEFHFGWSPLISDIKGAVDVLQGGIPPMKVYASGYHEYWNMTSHQFVDYPSPSLAWKYQYRCRARVGCKVIGVNPDLMLANQLGLTSPQMVVWETVPFSFVVDWFSTVGDFLEQMSATVGFTLEGGWNTYLYEADGGETWFTWVNGGRGSDSWKGSGFQLQRELGIPLITIQLRPFKGFSVTRGLTAISLLLQALK